MSVSVRAASTGEYATLASARDIIIHTPTSRVVRLRVDGDEVRVSVVERVPHVLGTFRLGANSQQKKKELAIGAISRTDNV